MSRRERAIPERSDSTGVYPTARSGSGEAPLTEAASTGTGYEPPPAVTAAPPPRGLPGARCISPAPQGGCAAWQQRSRREVPQLLDTTFRLYGSAQCSLTLGVWPCPPNQSAAEQGVGTAAGLAGPSKLKEAGKAGLNLLSRAISRIRGGGVGTKGVPEGATSQILLRTPKQLQSTFNHAGDFGVSGNYSKANAAKFSEAIHRHINDPRVQAIRGTYRKQPATHHLDPSSGLNVMSDPAGNFISGWRLSQAQRQNVLKHGGL